MNPLVSVIIPIYNGERYLAEALDSVAAQDYDAIETIVVDNGSTDGGPALAAARGITVLHLDQRGAGAARNAGVDRARGEILAFLDQDDVWLPAKLRRQVEMLAAHPDRICIAQQAYFIEPGHEKPAWFGKEHLLHQDHAGWAPSCLAVRRETFERVGRFDESLQHGSDVDWHARASHLGIAVERPPETLVRRRIHDANNSAALAAMTEFFTIVRSAVRRRKSTTTPENA
jgi:glycosyltransferase involved in cell wall biosynthesis